MLSPKVPKKDEKDSRVFGTIVYFITKVILIVNRLG